MTHIPSLTTNSKKTPDTLHNRAQLALLDNCNELKGLWLSVVLVDEKAVCHGNHYPFTVVKVCKSKWNEETYTQEYLVKYEGKQYPLVEVMRGVCCGTDLAIRAL